MSFKINSVEGTVAEIDVDLSVPSQHEREDIVIPAIKKAITDIVESLGGYLSISANGNINPVSGETGDVVNIYITSLPAPNLQTTITPEVQTGEPTPVTEESPQPQPPVTPENVEPISTESHPEMEAREQQESAPSEPPVTITEVEATIDSGEVLTVVEPPAETPSAIQENPLSNQIGGDGPDVASAPENPAETAPEVSLGTNA